MRALLAPLLLLLAGLAAAATEDTAALPAPDTALADDLRANTIVGLVKLAQALDAAGTTGPRDFAPAERDALILGMPPRIRPFLSRIDEAGHAVDVVAVTVRPHPTLTGRRQLVVSFADEWIAPKDGRGRFGSASVKGHLGSIWLSRAQTVVATINGERIHDPRATGAPAYDVCQDQCGILTEDATAKRLPAHPWTQPGQDAPLGLEDIAGLSLQIRISGWWKDYTDIQPVSHLFVYTDTADAHIWLGYKELIGHIDRAAQRFQTTNASFDAGLPTTLAFPEYLGLTPTAKDRFSVSDLTVEAR